MKEPHGEDIASRTGPESCVGVRKGAGEALTGVRTGWVLSRESILNRGADAFALSGRQHRRHRYRDDAAGPREVADPTHVRKLLAQELGDPALGPGHWVRGPRREPGKGTTAMNEHGKSDRPIVPKKLPNKGSDASLFAEGVEGRGLAKENLLQQNQSIGHRAAPDWPNAVERIRQAGKPRGLRVIIQGKSRMR